MIFILLYPVHKYSMIYVPIDFAIVFTLSVPSKYRFTALFFLLIVNLVIKNCTSNC